MKQIYNALIQERGRLYEFANLMVEKGLYKTDRSAVQSLRLGVTHKQDIQDLYDTWKGGKFKTKDVDKHNEKVAKVFADIKRRSLKDELTSIVEVLESSLMELTLAIKKDDKEKLHDVKHMLQSALYGDVACPIYQSS